MHAPHLHLPFHRRVARAYAEHVNYRKRAALHAWIAFIITFAILRFITYGIRYHFLPLQNVTTPSGAHIHHFVWGVFLLIIVGFLGLMVEEAKWHPRFAYVFGIAAALVIDEVAIWVTFEDVYWTDAGRISVDIAILIIAGFGAFFAASRFWREVWRELKAALGLAVRGERALLHHHEEAADADAGKPDDD